MWTTFGTRLYQIGYHPSSHDHPHIHPTSNIYDNNRIHIVIIFYLTNYDDTFCRENKTKTQKCLKGRTEIRTRMVGFKVPNANRYIIRPLPVPTIQPNNSLCRFRRIIYIIYVTDSFIVVESDTNRKTRNLIS